MHGKIKNLTKVLLIIALFSCFIRITTEMFLNGFNSTKRTVMEQREVAKEAELTALVDTIVLKNQSLELLQAFCFKWNSFMFPRNFKNIERIV